MQLEKHISITKTPNGALVSFGGQVCLTIFESKYRDQSSFFWQVSPVFAKLTYAANSFSDIPHDSNVHSTMAEAVADGLIKLDELKAFYGVVSLPVDTYVGEHEDTVSESVEVLDEGKFLETHLKSGKPNPNHPAYSKHKAAYDAEQKANRAPRKARTPEENPIKMHHIDVAISNSFPDVEPYEHLKRQFPHLHKENHPTHGTKLTYWADKTVAAHDKKHKSLSSYADAAYKDMHDDKMMGEEITFAFNEVAIAEALKSIKEDCRNEALSVSDSLVEAHQLAQELFEDIAEEYLNELSKTTLGSYVKKAVDSNREATSKFREIGNDKTTTALYADPEARKQLVIKKNRDKGTAAAMDKLGASKRDTTSVYRAGLPRSDSAAAVKKANAAIDRLTKEEVEELGEVWAAPNPDKMSKSEEAKYIARLKARNTKPGKEQNKKNESVEELDEAIDADHYHATSEPSQFGGYRPKVVHKRKGTTMYLGQYGYKTKAAATEGAKAYLDAYAKFGDMAASRAVAAHASKHPDYIKEEVLDEEVTFSGKGANGVQYKIIKTGDDHSIHADGKHIDTYGSHQRAMSVLKNEVPGLKADLKEEVLDEALDEALSGDAYWKAKEAESKEEYLKAQRKALGLPEPVKRGRGKPTNIDRDLLKSRAHSNVEAGKRPTAGFDRNEKIHFVRHLKNHPDFADKHVSQAGRPVGTTKVASQQKELAKKKQDTAFSMWAGLGKR